MHNFHLVWRGKGRGADGSISDYKERNETSDEGREILCPGFVLIRAAVNCDGAKDPTPWENR